MILRGMADAVVPLLPAFQELPPAVQSLRDERHRAFAWAYMFNGANGAAAARAAGYSDVKEAAKVRAHALLARPDIQEALRELCTKFLFSLAPKALIRLNGLLDKPAHKQHAKAISMVLSRTGFAERTAIDVNHQHSAVDHTKEALTQLRMLKGLMVPREKLIEMFGYSGLSRYEKLLELEDQRAAAGSVIDGECTEVTTP
jgi:phage terminase small subunit